MIWMMSCKPRACAKAGFVLFLFRLLSGAEFYNSNMCTLQVNQSQAPLGFSSFFSAAEGRNLRLDKVWSTTCHLHFLQAYIHPVSGLSLLVSLPNITLGSNDDEGLAYLYLSSH
ncbi:hypothetical protein BDW66DRAFT_123472 [Aspergillus desertorum]